MGRKKNRKKKTTTYVTRCTHNYVKRVMKIGNATIYAGSVWEVKGALPIIRPKLALSMMGDSGAGIVRSRKVSLTPEARHMLPSIASSRLGEFAPSAALVLDWPDGGDPGLRHDWWMKLVHDLSKVQGNVTVFCMGGHGRTGTALTMLAYLAGIVPKDQDPVKWVRATYCNEAVETANQIKYLRELGVPTNAGPSDPKGGVWYSDSGGGWYNTEWPDLYKDGPGRQADLSDEEWQAKLEATATKGPQPPDPPLTGDEARLRLRDFDDHVRKEGPCAFCGETCDYNGEAENYLCKECKRLIDF